jgi:3-hydroxyacyl-CoA dehydrogenase
MEDRVLRLDKHIRNAAVIGAGMMGGQIAALVASADIPVLLLDIVPAGANDRDILARAAIEKIAAHASLSIRNGLHRIEPGNTEDHMDKLSGVDWIIECVSEDVAVKHCAYQSLSSYIEDHALVSSNTSSIPLAELRKGLPHHMQKKMCITHFFNPPEARPLLELVTDQDNDQEDIVRLQRFADQQLGRTVIEVRDTPGFIANRIGIFWILAAMEEAQKENIPVEVADNLMNGVFGFPKTGIFGWIDFVGLNTIPDIVKSMSSKMPREDELLQLKAGLTLIEARLKEDKGFYNENKSVIDLKSGAYRPFKKPRLNITDWRAFLQEDTPESRFVCRTLVRLLHYTLQVTPAIAENILQVDIAMRDGYGWEFGPFQILERLGGAWLTDLAQKQGLPPLEFLTHAVTKNGFYPEIPRRGKSYLTFDGTYLLTRVGLEKWPLALKTSGKKPVLENEAAQLWDIEDGIVCFSITTKMGLIDACVLDLLERSLDKVETDFQGLVIGNDRKNFSAGMDLHIVEECAAAQDWQRLEDLLRHGQRCMLKIRALRAPTIAAISGYALGGGCEIAMHCAGAQIHAYTKMGLVEADIGVIPGWGGLSAHLINAVGPGTDDIEAITQKVLRAFRQVAGAQKSSDAEDAIAMAIPPLPSRITYNRYRLLPDAKDLCRNVSMTRTVHRHKDVNIPVDALYANLQAEIEGMRAREPDMTPHREHLLKHLAQVLSGYAAVNRKQNGAAALENGWARLTERELMQTSLDAFMELIREDESLQKIKAVLRQ